MVNKKQQHKVDECKQVFNNRTHRDKSNWKLKVEPEETDKVKITLVSKLKYGNPIIKEKVIGLWQKSHLDKIPLRLKRKRQAKE